MKVLEGEFREGDTVRIDVDGGTLTFSVPSQRSARRRRRLRAAEA